MERASLQAVFEQIEAWLLESADQHTSLRALTGELAQRLHAAGLPLARVNLGVFALHPEIAGYAVIWDPTKEEALEVPIRREDTRTATYINSPSRALVEERRHLRYRLVKWS